MPTAQPVYFTTAGEFRRWLAKHHASESVLLVGFHRRATGTPSITYPEALDEALCFGWIDGVRRTVDEDRYTIRFTPRKNDSYWSIVNTAKAEALIAQGRMHGSGLKVFQSRDAARTGEYEYEREAATMTPAMRRTFRANAKAWKYYASEAPWYRRVTTWYVVGAKRPETRAARLATLIACSAKGERLPGIAKYTSKKTRA